MSKIDRKKINIRNTIGTSTMIMILKMMIIVIYVMENLDKNNDNDNGPLDVVVLVELERLLLVLLRVLHVGPHRVVQHLLAYPWNRARVPRRAPGNYNADVDANSY